MSTAEGHDTGKRGTDDGMAEFGYTQSLERSIGKFASFARHQVGTLPEHAARHPEEAP